MILGIDQSYTRLGFCVLDGEQEVVEFGTFTTDTKQDIYDRAATAAQFVVDKMLEHNITELHIEGLAFGMVGNATRDLAGLLFIIVSTVRRLTKSPTICIIAPTAAKKTATGSGKAHKKEMIESLPLNVAVRFKESYKKTTGLPDIADAYWIARTFPPVETKQRK